MAICTNPRQYQRISDAADEVVDARIWLGIHFRFADDVARRQGTRVAHWVFERSCARSTMTITMAMTKTER